MSGPANDVCSLRQNRHGRFCTASEKSGSQRRVHIQNTQLPAAKVSSPKFPGKVRNSPDISKGIFESGMWEFESSQVSHPVRRPEKMSLILTERPTNRGLSGMIDRSPGSDFGHSQSEIADSLRRTFKKLPFFGDCGWRPGSICTAWPTRQCIRVFAAVGHIQLQQRLRPQPPPTNLRMSRSITAPMKVLMIKATIPTPR